MNTRWNLARTLLVLLFSIPVGAHAVHDLLEHSHALSPVDGVSELPEFSGLDAPDLEKEPNEVPDLTIVSLAQPVVEKKSVITVLIEGNKQGRAWDMMGGKPDPYIIVDGISFRSQRCRDTHICQFQTPVTDSVYIEVWEADLHHDDYVGAAECRVGEVCEIEGGQVTVF